MHGAPFNLGGIGAPAVDGAAGIHDRGAGGHFRVRDLVLRGLGPTGLFERRQFAIGPAVTPGDDARRAVVAGEVDEGDHGRELEFTVGTGNVAPHRFVTVLPLLVGTGPALQEMADVQLVTRARRQENAIAQGE
jgi:hypothetical protein